MDRGLFTSVIFPLIPKPNADVDRGKTIPRMRYRYTRYLATLVLGRDTFHEEKAVTPSQKFVYLMALVVSVFKKKQTHSPSAEFVPQSDEYRISFDMRDSVQLVPKEALTDQERHTARVSSSKGSERPGRGPSLAESAMLRVVG